MTNETFSDRLKLAMQAKQFKQVDLIRAAQRRGVKLGKSITLPNMGNIIASM